MFSSELFCIQHQHPSSPHPTSSNTSPLSVAIQFKHLFIQYLQDPRPKYLYFSLSSFPVQCLQQLSSPCNISICILATPSNQHVLVHHFQLRHLQHPCAKSSSEVPADIAVQHFPFRHLHPSLCRVPGQHPSSALIQCPSSIPIHPPHPVPSSSSPHPMSPSPTSLSTSPRADAPMPS